MSGRVEIITGPERRRRWSEEEKLQLVEEACRPGCSVSQVARQRGINASQLFAWRRHALAKGVVSDNRTEPSAVPALTFASVKVAEETAVDLLLTTDQRIRYQQNLTGRKIAIVVLAGTTKWSRVRLHLEASPPWWMRPRRAAIQRLKSPSSKLPCFRTGKKSGERPV